VRVVVTGLPLTRRRSPRQQYPPPRKDEYNGASTMDDARKFEADIVKSLRNLGTDKTHINMILDMVRKGDILRLDLTVPNTGPGGNNPTGALGKWVGVAG